MAVIVLALQVTGWHRRSWAHRSGADKLWGNAGGLLQ